MVCTLSVSGSGSQLQRCDVIESDCLHTAQYERGPFRAQKGPAQHAPWQPAGHTQGALVAGTKSEFRPRCLAGSSPGPSAECGVSACKPLLSLSAGLSVAQSAFRLHREAHGGQGRSRMALSPPGSFLSLVPRATRAANLPGRRLARPGSLGPARQTAAAGRHGPSWDRTGIPHVWAASG